MSDRQEKAAYGVALAGFVSPAVQRAIDAAGAKEYVPGPSRAAAYRMAGKFILRMSPWIAAAELGVVLWEINRRRNDTFKETAKVGPGEDSLLFRPAGWSELWNFWTCYGLDPVNFPTVSRVGYRWNAAFPIPSDCTAYSPLQDYPLNSPLIHPDLPTGPGAVVTVQDVQSPNTTTFGHQVWINDGGPGSTTSYYGDVVEWEPPQHYWKVQPDVVPTILPDITNPGQRQRQAVPIPQRELWKLPRWKTEFGDYIYRESESPAPTRPVDDVVLPDDEEAPVPVRPPRPRPGTGPDDAVIYPTGPDTEVRWQSNSHRYVPVEPHTREVKLSANTKRLAYRAMNAMTETHDFVSGVHKALPKRCRRSRSWRGQDGKWHRALVSSMMRDIYNCAGDLNIQRAIIHVVANQLQDLAVGRLNRALNERSRLLGGTTGIQGYGTRVGRAFDHAEWHWSQLITDAGDYLAAQSPGWSFNSLRKGL